MGGNKRRKISRTAYRKMKKEIERECRRMFQHSLRIPSTQPGSSSESQSSNLSHSDVNDLNPSTSRTLQYGENSGFDRCKESTSCIFEKGIDDLISEHSSGDKDSLSVSSLSLSDSSLYSLGGDEFGNALCEENTQDPESSDDLSWRDKIRHWAVRHQISRAALGDILKLLKPAFPDIPLDAKTILQTGKKVAVEVMGQGFYYNFGLREMLSSRIRLSKSLGNKISLNFGIDTIPIFKSSKSGLTPILGLITKSKGPPFVCAMYYGPEKPTVDMLLKDFAPELDDLLDNGIEVDGKFFEVEVNCFVCDTPARSYVKCVKGLRGYYSCERCIQRGTEYRSRRIFENMAAVPRTDESFACYTHPEHHTGVSPLTDIGVLMVTQFVLDYMHLVCLGVMKKLLFSWINNKKKYKFSSRSLKLIDLLLTEAAKIWPSDFNRKPRSLDDLKRWKATELRQFLLYAGPVVLKRYLPKVVFEHFLLLHAAITIFTREDLHSCFHAEGVAFLREFVRKGKCPELYGRKFLICNVHNLLHLGDDVKKFGALDNISAFVFENELQKLKKMIHGQTKPLQQIINKIKNTELFQTDEDDMDGVISSSEWDRGVTLDLFGGKQYSQYRLNKRILSLKNGNNFVMLDDSSVVKISNFYEKDKEITIIGKRFVQYTDLYTTPMSSSQLGIFVVENLSDFQRKIPVQRLKSKCLAFPMERKGAFAIFPLINTI